eukprot:GHVT01025218.1.p1 GENE.GHVT01025218.1~~GHVT01025218.1.p1  ORF type:complete len:308 (+),score=52.23 GHVT01025218.1:1215-2138(+)
MESKCGRRVSARGTSQPSAVPQSASAPHRPFPPSRLEKDVVREPPNTVAKHQQLFKNATSRARRRDPRNSNHVPAASPRALTPDNCGRPPKLLIRRKRKAKSPAEQEGQMMPSLRSSRVHGDALAQVQMPSPPNTARQPTNKTLKRRTKAQARTNPTNTNNNDSSAIINNNTITTTATANTTNFDVTTTKQDAALSEPDRQSTSGFVSEDRLVVPRSPLPLRRARAQRYPALLALAVGCLELDDSSKRRGSVGVDLGRRGIGFYGASMWVDSPDDDDWDPQEEYGADKVLRVLLSAYGDSSEEESTD